MKIIHSRWIRVSRGSLKLSGKIPQVDKLNILRKSQLQFAAQVCLSVISQN